MTSMGMLNQVSFKAYHEQRAWICVHFLIQAHFFLADANLEAGLSHAARDARPNTATK